MTDDPIDAAKKHIRRVKQTPERLIDAANASLSEAERLGLPADDPAQGVAHDAKNQIARIERALGREREANRTMREAVITYGNRVTKLFRAGAALCVIAVLVFGFIAYRLQSVQDQFSGSAYTGCLRSNAQNAALLDLGKIITLARAQTSTSPRVRKAARDYLVQVRKLDPSMPATKALNDLAILLAGDRGKPADARELAAAEDDFIKRARQIEKPRDCARLFRP